MIVVAQTGKNRFSPITSCREQRKSSFQSFYKYRKAWKGAFSGIVSLNVMNHFMPYLINNRDRNRFLSRSGTGSGAKKFAKILSFLCHCRCDSCRWKSSQFAWELWIVDGEGSCTQCGNTLALITSKKNESSRDSAWTAIIGFPHTSPAMPTSKVNVTRRCLSSPTGTLKEHRPSIEIGNFSWLYAFMRLINNSKPMNTTS